MKRTHKDSYFPVKHTILEHQVLILKNYMSLYFQEGLQRVRFLIHQTTESKTLAPETCNLS